MSTRTRSTLAVLAVLAAAVLVHLPPLALPLIDDDHHTLYQAARTLQDTSNFREPWMGGAFRPIPKLYFMGAFATVGDSPVPYRLVNLALHLLATLAVIRVTRRLAGDERGALLAGLLFGLGFGGYLRAVFQISNATLLGAGVLLLAAVELALARRRVPAFACWLLAGLCHEVALVAPLLWPWLRAADAGESPPALRRILIGTLGALGIAALLPLGALREIARRVVEQTWFFLLPINTPERALRRLDVPREVLDPLVTFADVLTSERMWPGLALLAGAILLVRARRARTSLAVAWTYAFLLPPAWLIVTAPEAGPLWKYGWLERRYLYVPGIAVSALTGAWLAAHWDAHASAVRRWTRAAGCALLLWIVTMDAITWDNYRRLSRTGGELERRARFEQAIEEMKTRR